MKNIALIRFLLCLVDCPTEASSHPSTGDAALPQLVPPDAGQHQDAADDAANLDELDGSSSDQGQRSVSGLRSASVRYVRGSTFQRVLSAGAGVIFASWRRSDWWSRCSS